MQPPVQLCSCWCSYAAGGTVVQQSVQLCSRHTDLQPPYSRAAVGAAVQPPAQLWNRRNSCSASGTAVQPSIQLPVTAFSGTFNMSELLRTAVQQHTVLHSPTVVQHQTYSFMNAIIIYVINIYSSMTYRTCRQAVRTGFNSMLTADWLDS